jgi:hypothetical protein
MGAGIRIHRLFLCARSTLGPCTYQSTRDLTVLPRARVRALIAILRPSRKDGGSIASWRFSAAMGVDAQTALIPPTNVEKAGLQIRSKGTHFR